VGKRSGLETRGYLSLHGAKKWGKWGKIVTKGDGPSVVLYNQESMDFRIRRENLTLGSSL
jgi:hypothetical protein